MRIYHQIMLLLLAGCGPEGTQYPYTAKMCQDTCGDMPVHLYQPGFCYNDMYPNLIWQCGTNFAKYDLGNVCQCGSSK